MSRAFRLIDCFFEATKLTNNDDNYKYGHSSYSTGFFALSKFSWSDSEVGNIVVISGVKNSLSVHADSREKEILGLGEEPMDDLNYTLVTPKAKYIFNITKSRKKINLSLHYNPGNNFLYANCTKIQTSIVFSKYFKRNCGW